MIFGKGKKMKTVWVKILALMFITVSAVSFTVIAQDVRPPAEPVFEDEMDGPPEYWRPDGQMSEEMMERILERMKKTDPETAVRLQKLREEDPEKFAEELRKVMEQHRQQRPRMRDSRQPRRRREPMAGRDIGGGYGDRLRKMRQRHEEYIEWLGKNYPEDANALEAIRRENPQLYMRKLRHSAKKYGRIAEAAEDNPALAQVLKENISLKDNRDAFLKKMQTADTEEKEKLSIMLQGIVAKRFDLIVKRKQLQHEQLLKKLERLKEQVKDSEVEVDKWKASKDEKVKERVKELIGRTEKFHWD